MSCKTANEMTFAVYEIAPGGREDFVNNFSLSKEETRQMLLKHGLSAYNTPGVLGGDTGTALIIAMFEKVYGFSKGPNGFNLKWEYVDGYPGRYDVGTIYWREDVWRIRRVK
jgi:hypothetical protein